jgi:uncharacterized protein (TIGR02444 family)
MAASDAAADAFWRFSLMLYARPGVAEALIRLQDRGGHNVNLILFGLWLGVSEGRRLDAAGLAHARAAIEGLDRAIVAPLRRLRRALKDDPDPDVRDLRGRVLALEIAAERRVQARLAASAGGRRKSAAGGRRGIAEVNLRLVLGADFAAAEAALLRRALGAI